eukprot:TRINITY_DN7261_c0_g1_i11.p2 TRINITY_DN7261_c0_g1~~TRINITY_DN7261_c0_g1_i11.p2  ORF type:complete len:104 (+),score=20.49 TRINITY_DN7261_c0_g1_i11:100-411(+)
MTTIYREGVAPPRDELKETLKALKERRGLRRGHTGEHKSDLLRLLERVMPFVTVICLAPLIYALFQLFSGQRGRQEELLRTLLSEVRDLRTEVRELSEGRCTP